MRHYLKTPPCWGNPAAQRRHRQLGHGAGKGGPSPAPPAGAAPAGPARTGTIISFSFLEQSKTNANDSSFHASRWHPPHRFLRVSTLNPTTSKGLFINKSLSSTWMSPSPFQGTRRGFYSPLLVKAERGCALLPPLGGLSGTP